MKSITNLLVAAILVLCIISCNNSTNTQNTMTSEDSTMNTTDHTSNGMATDTSGNVNDSLHAMDSTSH